MSTILMYNLDKEKIEYALGNPKFSFWQDKKFWVPVTFNKSLYSIFV